MKINIINLKKKINTCCDLKKKGIFDKLTNQEEEKNILLMDDINNFYKSINIVDDYCIEKINHLLIQDRFSSINELYIYNSSELLPALFNTKDYNYTYIYSLYNSLDNDKKRIKWISETLQLNNTACYLYDKAFNIDNKYIVSTVDLSSICWRNIIRQITL